MNHEQLIERIYALVREAGSQSALAEQLNISRPYLSDILTSKREPGKTVLAKLGLERVIVYREVKPVSKKGGR